MLAKAPPRGGRPTCQLTRLARWTASAGALVVVFMLLLPWDMDVSVSLVRLANSIASARSYSDRFDIDSDASDLELCFRAVPGSGDMLNFSVGAVTAVVPLSGLVELSREYGGDLSLATAASLHAFIRGGVRHVVLVPGSAAWTEVHARACRTGLMTGAVDGRGFHVDVAFSALSPTIVTCIGAPPAGLGAGIAWALASGASAVLSMEHVSAFSRRALFFDTALPRLLPQVSGLHVPSSLGEPGNEPLSPDWLPVPRQLQQHFTACGGAATPCSPSSSLALRLCSSWLRPAVQYGLCHDRELYAPGRHGSLAANSPHDDTLYSGPRLLEEVATLTLEAGAAFALRPDSRFTYNRLADREAAWILVDDALGGSGAQLAVEAAFALVLGGNLTVLPPGRLCNVTRGSRDNMPKATSLQLPPLNEERWREAAGAAIAAGMRDILSEQNEGPITEPSEMSENASSVPAAALVAAVHSLAFEAVRQGGLSIQGALALRKWMRLCLAAQRLYDRWRWQKRPQLAVAEKSRGSATLSRTRSATASESLLSRSFLPPPVPSPLVSPPPLVFSRLPPASRAVYPHCFAGHHNVRDILYFIQFNNFRPEWGRDTLAALLGLMRPFYPAIIAAHSGRPGDERNRGYVGNGIDELNLERCIDGSGGGGGGWFAQRCAADAMNRYSGHLGYVISNDDVHVSPWNMLGYNPSRFWRKPKTVLRSFYNYGTTDGDCKAFKPRELGAATLGRMHARLPAWVLPVKLANFNRTDGVSCQTVDAYYVPGELSEFAAWFLLETFREGTFIELATSTLFDTAARRDEHDELRVIHMGANVPLIRETYRLALHDYTHSLKLSTPEALDFSSSAVNAALAADLFYVPNMTRLTLRPAYSNMWR